MFNTRVGRRTLLDAAAKTGAGLLAGSLFAGPAATHSASAAPAEDTLTRARRQGYIMVAFNINKPKAYIDPTTGQFSGSGPAVLRPILKRLGIPDLKYTVVDFAGIIPGLQDRRWDLSGFPFFITRARCAQVAFTDPVARYREGGLVRSGNPFKIHGYADLAKDPQIKVSIQEGDAEVVWAKQAGVKNIVLFPQEPLAVEALKEGRVDAYLNSTFSLREDMKNYGGQGIELATPFTGPIVNGKEVTAYGAFALRHEDISLLRGLNAQIAAMRTSGELLRLEAPYDYAADDIPPGTVTTSNTLCI